MVNIKIVFFSIIILFNKFKCNEFEFYSSTEHMRPLIQTSIQFTEFLKAQLQKTLNNDKTIYEFYIKLDNLNRFALANVRGFIGNPINCFKLVMHLTYDLSYIKTYAESNMEFSKQLEIQKSKLHLPAKTDLLGVIMALLRLGDTYKITPMQFINNNLSSNYPSLKLTASEVILIASTSYSHEDYHHATEWYRAGYDIVDFESPIKQLLIEFYVNSTIKENNFNAAKELLNHYLKNKPNDEKAKLILKRVKKLIKKSSTAENIDKDKDTKDTNNVKLNFESLCRGENVIIPRNSSLKCRYIFNAHPYFTIRPIKEEVVYLDPLILVYHDFVTRAQAFKIKKFAFPHLTRATVLSKEYSGDSNIRISKLSWIPKNIDKTLDDLELLVGALVKLNMTYVEEWQVLNYGVGGHFHIHDDYLVVLNTSKGIDYGNRLATWMIYLDEPEYGGSTVFTKLNLNIKPEFGSSIFWYNTYMNGTKDSRLQHAGCPVLFGSKWVANKWIRLKAFETSGICDLK